MLKIYLILFACAVLSGFTSTAMAATANVTVASSGYLERRLETTVTTTGDQSIAGTKTYSESPIVPTPQLL